MTIKFKYKNNHYMLNKDDGKFRIRSNGNTNGTGYSWFVVTDPDMITKLWDIIANTEGEG